MIQVRAIVTEWSEVVVLIDGTKVSYPVQMRPKNVDAFIYKLRNCRGVIFGSNGLGYSTSIRDLDNKHLTYLVVDFDTHKDAKEFSDKFISVVQNCDVVYVDKDGNTEQATTSKASRHDIPERILCAAIHNPSDTDIAGQSLIYCGLRHPNILWQSPDISRNLAHQGFLTSKGRFVDRKEALQIALANNQVLDIDNIRGNSLYSEDLY